LCGIINAIDDSWNAAEDPYLPYHFDAGDLTGKRGNAEMVRTSLCLRPSDGPLFGVVARLVHQKGLDLVAEAASDIVARGGQIAILGLGDPAVEQVLSRAARRHRDDIAILVGFNEPVARRIIAGSDFFLMPSRFEPCGLTQMQAQRYGALPIAHAVGGLVDTIEDGVTGFLFSDPTADGLAAACGRAFDVFAYRPKLDTMRRAAMTRRFSWSASAAEYASVYRRYGGKVAPRRMERATSAPRRVALDLEVAA
jgi:starch synthase